MAGAYETFHPRTDLTGGQGPVQSNSCSRERKRAKSSRFRPSNLPAIWTARRFETFGRHFIPEEEPMAAVALTVNGKPVTADVDPRTLLVQLLRENLRLTGTHVGCDTSQCGACVVHIDGKATKSCTVLALQLEGANVLTIEGLAP